MIAIHIVVRFHVVFTKLFTIKIWLTKSTWLQEDIFHNEYYGILLHICDDWRLSFFDMIASIFRTKLNACQDEYEEGRQCSKKVIP